MARIRSIKPEFITDGDVSRMSDSCALFFVALWNFCDDEGKHRLDLNQLVAELGGRWFQDKINLFITCLLKSGQLRISSDSAWIQVTGWSHQKIDRPRQPDVKASDIQWLSAIDSANVRDKSRSIDARIGSDRIDRIGSELRKGQAKERSTKSGKPPAVNAHAFITAYCDAWKERYGANPPITGRAAGTAKRLAGDLGIERACDLVRSYLRMNEAWFVKKRHDLMTFEHSLTSVVQFHDTGVQITGIEAQHVENRQASLNVWGPIMDEAIRQHGGKS